MNRESIWELVRRYAARVGCANEIVHIRYGTALPHICWRAGADIRALQEMLGHSSIRTTQIYIYVEHSRLKSVHKQCHPRG